MSTSLLRFWLLLCCCSAFHSTSGLREEPSSEKPFHFASHHDGKDSAEEFTNEWVVHLEGAKNSADLVALKLGYENLGEVKTLLSLL